jgi:sec-independent protein translocase protein TatC
VRIPQRTGLDETADRDQPMSLMDHLNELRGRLFRCVVAVLVLGIASLVFSKPIFGLLMRPVLDALPVDQRSLIYTSGIEEINVLMKVGLYCGIFLSTPVLLWQLWGFVSPGLFPSERRMASPFIVLGTLAFLTGASFCYFVVLPTMFQFLLQEPEVAERRAQLMDVRQTGEEALRLVRLGDYAKAGELAEGAVGTISDDAESAAPAIGAHAPDPGVEARARLDALGRLVDAATIGAQAAGRPILKQVMDLRLEAVTALGKGDRTLATQKMDEAAGRLAAISPADASQLGSVWRLEKDLATGQTRLDAANWTRPMLTMSEQLSLVLILELAMGIIFEMPLVMALLALVGLVQSKWLFRYQRHAIVVCMIAAAIITPTGDAVNLALLAGPMVLCYELGVVAVWMIEKRRKTIGNSEAMTVKGSQAPP